MLEDAGALNWNHDVQFVTVEWVSGLGGIFLAQKHFVEGTICPRCTGCACPKN